MTCTNNTTGGAAATSTYGWFANGWLANEGQPLGAVSYAYDAYGKRTQLTWPGGFYVTYGYNDGDELTGIFENGTSQIASFGYDDYGRRTTLGRGNGQTTGYGYDAALRLQSLSHPANAVSLSYSEADQIRTRTNSNSAFTPPSPGAATTIYGADGLNRMTMAGSASLGYDGRGNMTSDGSVTFGYNANNLLTTTSAGASLAYDAENRLARIARSGYATTRFLYDGVDVIAEYDDAGTVLRRYVHGPGMDEPLVWYEGSGTGDKRYYHADPQGSVTQVTNGSGGSVGINRYDAYGVPAGGNVGRFQYTGQMWLPEVGLYYYKARMYSPSLGRFLQTDPIGYEDGMNWYAYVGNDPVNYTDPFGLKKVTVTCDMEVSLGVWVPCGFISGDDDGWRSNCNDLCRSSIRMEQERFRQVIYEQDRRDTLPTFLGYVDFITTPAQLFLGAGSKVATTTLKAGATVTSKTGARNISTRLAKCCFVAGTLVVTDKGLRAIETLKVGDLVLSKSAETGETAYKPITDLISDNERVIYDLRFEVRLPDGSTREARFETTDDHPWMSKDGQWLNTDQLNPGVGIQTAYGEAVTVKSVTNTGQTQPTFNLTVADFQTYFVGEDRVWVHNSCDPSQLTYLYQKVSMLGQHLKIGITSNPLTRYTQRQLAGGRLRIVASGRRDEMLALERHLHRNLPRGREDGRGH